MAGRMGVLKEIEDLPDVNEIGRAQASQQTQAMTDVSSGDLFIFKSYLPF
jgi:hypothetical protein